MVDNHNGRDQQHVRNHTSIDIITSDTGFVASMMEKLSAVSPLPGQCCCIYKVHKKLYNINEYAYVPEMVSIGPFHHGDENLQVMEDHKLRYMDALLMRTGNKEAKLEKCFEDISGEEDTIRNCYSTLVEPDSQKFIEMMICDGLFTIELFLRSIGDESPSISDPIFDNIWTMSSLVRDMILLENQLPMLVLDKLFSITMGDQGGKSLNELAIHFFNPLMPRKKAALADYFKSGKHLKIKGHHLLDLLSKTFHEFHGEVKSNGNKKSKDNQKEDEGSKLRRVPCVTDLRQAGVQFRKGNDRGNFLDINFKEGVLEIPQILVQDQTDTLLRNLIASEQCSDGRDTYMTSYAYLMDCLIDSPDDVAYLCKHGIIKNYLGHDECVSSLFNKLCSEVTLMDSYYSDLSDKLNAYYTKRWNIWYATLKRQYLRSPWKVISLGTAFVIAVTTVLAALFSILSYAKHHS